MFRLRFSSQTDSTNDDAAALLGTAEGLGLVLQTDYQRAGRGRRGREWIAAPGSALLFTATLPNALAADALWCVPFWTALAVADGVERAAGVQLDLQWPNDLLLGERKAGGILCVSRVSGMQAWVGCGVGLNVRRPVDVDIPKIEPPPAFLSDAASDIGREVVLHAILGAFESSLTRLAQPRAVARAWEQRASLAGTPYRLLLDGSDAPFEAVALRLETGGSLVVEHAGRERVVALADARVQRSASA